MVTHSQVATERGGIVAGTAILRCFRTMTAAMRGTGIRNVRKHRESVENTSVVPGIRSTFILYIRGAS